MTIYIDIDETICNTPEASGRGRDYSKSTPIKKNINKINEMHDKGHDIVYWTARGGTTGEDHSEITVKQMKEWGAKFNELRFGKPSYDLFICDKAINSRDYFLSEE